MRSETFNNSIDNHTIMESRKDDVLEPFFNSLKYWHFNELLESTKLSRSQLSGWLKVLVREGMIKRVKQKGKMPYYVGNRANPSFLSKKRLFALTQLLESGLWDHLSSLSGAKVVILFGSFSRWDWHKESDIDVFILGDDSDLLQGKFELKLKRDIEVHTARDSKELVRFEKMLPYIVSGDFIKGSITDLGVTIHAKA
jgi:predicted nucleotidyltransferase